MVFSYECNQHRACRWLLMGGLNDKGPGCRVGPSVCTAVLCYYSVGQAGWHTTSGDALADTSGLSKTSCLLEAAFAVPQLTVHRKCSCAVANNVAFLSFNVLYECIIYHTCCCRYTEGA
jgi:hypothetical protein